MKNRIAELRKRINFKLFDAVIIEDGLKRRYLTGFKSSVGMLVITQNNAFLCVDSRYIEAAQNIAEHCEVKLINGNKDFYYELCKNNNINRIAISGTTTISRLRRLKELFEPVEIFDDSNTDNVITEMAMIKDDYELECIKKAQRITDEAFKYILGEIKTGKTENELALALELYLRNNGSEGTAFDTILISGCKTSMPHGVPSNKVIENGDFVTMDFGAKVNGYCADMTRTVAVGCVSNEQKKVYEIVLEAQNNCLAKIKAGITGYEADNFARSIINDAGYGEYFGHSTGHSIGMEVHEQPSASPLDKRILFENETMTVEPGIYLPGEFGVRIEDLVILKNNGCENLTTSPKELIII